MKALYYLIHIIHISFMIYIYIYSIIATVFIVSGVKSFFFVYKSMSRWKAQ